MQTAAPITIPANLRFSALKLDRRPDGGVSFDWSPLEAICEASGINPALLRRSEDNTTKMVVAWYIHHRTHGGKTDPVAEELLAEEFGQLAELVAEFGSLLWGDHWPRPMAEALEVAERTIRRWIAGTETPRPGVITDLRRLAEARRDALSQILDRTAPLDTDQ